MPGGILVTGADGYVGWPTALAMALRYPNDQIIGVDNLSRRRWVEEIGGASAIPIFSSRERIDAAQNSGIRNLVMLDGDLTEPHFVRRLIRVHRPRAVVHLAAQPSAPYSQISLMEANYTQFNNNQSTRNLLWGLKEEKLVEECRFLITTTTGVYGSPSFEIPEGFLNVQTPTGSGCIPFHQLGGSWYHISRSADANNCWLANRQWGLSITDLRTAIVFGTHSPISIDDGRLTTRLDVDFYFGVVIHRFCAMAMVEFPLTVYGRGEQGKPLVSLKDCVDSLVEAVDVELDGKFQVLNQTMGPRRIMQIAEAVKEAGNALGLSVEIRRIPNPRVEDETHHMRIVNEKFCSLLKNRPLVDVREGIVDLMQAMSPHRQRVVALKSTFLSSDLRADVAPLSS